MADPQVNPNALGAPAEGFGQTVSFAFDPRGVTPALSLPKSTPGGMGVSGVSRTRGTDPNTAMQPIKEDGTAALLMKVGAEILGPKLEEERNAKFVSGIQKAMQGEAIKDMAESQPWYSRIFGDTPMVEGARAYTVSSKVNEVIAAETANLEKIKTLGPNDAAKYFASVIGKSQTGDASTDALITKNMVDQLPGLMKAQAKAHYGYGQKKAMDALSSNMATSGALLQQAGELYSTDMISDKDFEVRNKGFLGSIMPPEGINEDNYVKALAGNLRKYADLGHFHAIEAVRKSEGFGAMSIEQQNAVNAAVTAAAAKHRDQYAYKYVKEIAALKSDAGKVPKGTTSQEIVDRATKMNDAYRKLSGSPVGLFTSDEVANMGKGAIDFIKGEEIAAARRQEVLNDRTATADAKAAAGAEQAAAVSRMVSNGDAHLALRIKGVSKDEVDLEFMGRFRADPVSGTTMLRNNWIKGDGYVNPILKAEFAERLRGSEGHSGPSDDARLAIDNYKALRDGTGGLPLAQSYYGDYAPKIERFIRMTEGSPDGSMDSRAWLAATRGDGIEKPEPLSKPERAALASTVAKKTNTIIPRFLGGGVNHRADTLEVLAAIAEPAIEDWRGVGGMTDEQAVGNGIAAAITSRKVEVLGGYAIDRSTVESKLPTLKELAHGYAPKDSESEYFDAFMKTKTDGMDGSIRIHYQGKVKGSEQFMGSANSKDGEVKLFRFSAAEWQKFASETKLEATMPPEKPWYVMGPAITYQHNEQTRAIYSGRATKAELQAEQDVKSRKRNQP